MDPSETPLVKSYKSFFPSFTASTFNLLKTHSFSKSKGTLLDSQPKYPINTLIHPFYSLKSESITKLAQTLFNSKPNSPLRTPEMWTQILKNRIQHEAKPEFNSQSFQPTTPPPKKATFCNRIGVKAPMRKISTTFLAIFNHKYAQKAFDKRSSTTKSKSL